MCYKVSLYQSTLYKSTACYFYCSINTFHINLNNLLGPSFLKYIILSLISFYYYYQLYLTLLQGGIQKSNTG